MRATQTIPVQLWGGSSEGFQGRMLLQSWTPSEARKRARKKVLGILWKVALVPLVCVVHPILLLMITPVLVLVLIASIPVYMKWSEVTLTCVEVDGTCPACKKEGKLRPYLKAQYLNPMTVQCPACGQTVRAESSTASGASPGAAPS